jgi:WD40 repeat protein
MTLPQTPGQTSEVKLWDAATGRELRTLRTFQGPVWTLAFAPDGKQLAAAVGGRAVVLVDVDTGEERMTLPQTPGIRGLAFAPDGKTLATGRGTGAIGLWSTATWEERAVLPGHRGQVMTVAFAPDGKTLISAGKDGTAKLWDLRPADAVATKGKP